MSAMLTEYQTADFVRLLTGHLISLGAEMRARNETCTQALARKIGDIEQELARGELSPVAAAILQLVKTFYEEAAKRATDSTDSCHLFVLGVPSMVCAKKELYDSAVSVAA